MIGFSGRLPPTELLVSGGEMGFGVAFFGCLRGSMAMARGGEICEAKRRRRQEVYTVQPRGRHPEIRTLAPMGRVSNSQRIQVPRHRFTYDIRHGQMKRKTTLPQYDSRSHLGRAPDAAIQDWGWIHTWITHNTTDMGVGRSTSNAQLEPAKY